MPKSVMHELYMVRTNYFRYYVAQKNNNIFEKIEEIEKDLEKFIKEKIKEEGIRNKIISILDDLQSEAAEVQCYWDEIYYKEGLMNAIRGQSNMFDELIIDIFEQDIINKEHSKKSANVMQDKITKFVINKVVEEDVSNTILLKLDRLVKAINEERKFWRKKFYNKGYYDLLKFKREIEQYQF